MNNVTLIGNLVEAPELRFTASGAAMCKVRLAVNRSWKNQAGEWEEEANFFTGTCWRDLAENVAESFNKGDRVIVHGRMQQRSWDTAEGDRRSVVEVAIMDMGPSLRWATAQPQRVRTGSDDRHDNRRDRRDDRYDDRYDNRRGNRDEAQF